MIKGIVKFIDNDSMMNRMFFKKESPNKFSDNV